MMGRETCLFNDRLNETGKALVNKVCNNTNALRLARIQGPLDVASHVLLQHGLDNTTILFITAEDVLAAEQASLLGTVPVELDGVLGLALDDILALENSAEYLHNGD